MKHIAAVIAAADSADDAVEALVTALENYERAIRNLRIAQPELAVACNRAKSKNAVTGAFRNFGIDRFAHLQTTPGSPGGLARCAIDQFGLPTP